MQYEVQCGYLMFMLIYQIEIISTCVEMTQQSDIRLHMTNCSSNFRLLLSKLLSIL